MIKITAGTALNNTPSVKLLNSLGFRQTGTETVSFYKDEEGNAVNFECGIYEHLWGVETTIILWFIDRLIYVTGRCETATGS